MAVNPYVDSFQRLAAINASDDLARVRYYASNNPVADDTAKRRAVIEQQFMAAQIANRLASHGMIEQTAIDAATLNINQIIVEILKESHNVQHCSKTPRYDTNTADNAPDNSSETIELNPILQSN